jgi:PIN domain nuclease of toxin-antitoxin system
MISSLQSGTAMTISTADSYVVDTHTLIWYIENNPRLGANARRVMSDRGSTLFLPIIALAEACWIVEHGRCNIPSVTDLLDDIDGDSRIVLIPLERETIDLSVTLTAIGEMHDRLIVATTLQMIALGQAAGLLTRDNMLRLSGLVPVVW